jgi:Protein of unknown function, DUF547
VVTTLNDPVSRDPLDDAAAWSATLLHAARTAPEELASLARCLGGIDPAALPHVGDARGAFWVNVYNALMLHAVRAFDLRAGRRVPLGVFGRARYRVGGGEFSLHVIEHGLLRRNRPAPFTFWSPLRRGDPRLEAMPARFDPRVHFALNCAAASCPPIRAYTAAGFDRELDLATRAYVAQECTVDARRGVVRLPYLCGLYDRDFGDAAAALRWLRPYLDEEVARWVDAHPEARLAFNNYRWDVVRE